MGWDVAGRAGAIAGASSRICEGAARARKAPAEKITGPVPCPVAEPERVAINDVLIRPSDREY